MNVVRLITATAAFVLLENILNSIEYLEMFYCFWTFKICAG